MANKNEALNNMLLSLQILFEEQYGPGKLMFIPEGEEQKYLTTLSVDPKEIIPLVCKVCKVSAQDITGKCREIEIVTARQIIAALLQELYPGMSAGVISKMLHRDRTTIIYYFEKHAEHCQFDRKYKHLYQMAQHEVNRQFYALTHN